MRILLDTCVLSELQKPDRSVAVRDFIKEFAEDALFVSVISIGEIAKGVALLDDGARKKALQSWLNGLERAYSQRILTITPETARIWGEITAKARKQGLQVGAADGLIAATALCHGLHVITRNVSDFEPTGALIINPWEGEE